MEEFDSGWDEPPSSLDSEIMNNFDISEAMNGFEQLELHQQVLEMRADPTMSFNAPIVTNPATPENKKPSSLDYSSLSSEIFLATRLLHDETLDSTTLNTLGDTDSSPYNDPHNVNYLVGNHSQNGVQPDTIDAIGLPQRVTLYSEFLYSSFEHLNSEKRDYDEECSNKSWTESFPPSEIMPAPVQAISRKKVGEKKPRERKKRIVKGITKKSTSMDSTIEDVIKNSLAHSDCSDSTDALLSKSEHSTELRLKNPILSNALQNNTDVNLQNPPELSLKNPILSKALKNKEEISIQNPPDLQQKNPILSSTLQNNKEISIKKLPIITQTDSPIVDNMEIPTTVNPPLLTKNDFNTEIPLNNPPLVQQKTQINAGIDDGFLVPSTSGLNNNNNNNIQKKDGRRIPAYLKMYRLRDNQYSDVFACKNCFGIYTTLDAAIFHPCLKKRRGRRPKLLQDCVVPS